MSSEGNMPRKVFEVPFQKDPRPDIYKQLTLKNAEYPITDMDNEASYLPDFTRAVELTDNIYRINVPGYFYKCPSNGIFSSSQPSGIVIDACNYLMDTISHHDHIVSDIGSKVMKIKGEHATLRGINYDDSYVTEDYSLYLEAVETYPGPGSKEMTISWSNNSKVVWSKSTTLDTGTLTINGTTTHVVIVANQRRCPSTSLNGDGKPFAANLRCNYVVHAGKNNSGGIMNSMIPIIPGVATTDTPVGGALSETAVAFLTNIVKNTSNNKYYCVYHYKPIQGGSVPYGPYTSGIVEAKGTYVFANKAADSIFFVPAKSTPTDIKPVTKIRSTTSGACNYHIPKSSSSYDAGVGPTTSCSMHINDTKHEPIWGKEVNKTYSGTMNDHLYEDIINNCYIKLSPHSKPFDSVFKDIFKNPSITGHYGIFIAQKLDLEVWPGSCTNSVADINGHAVSVDSKGHVTFAHTVFNPRIDGD